MLDYICITSIISICQMGFIFMVVASIVTRWSYFIEICWHLSSSCYMKGHVLNYLRTLIKFMAIVSSFLSISYGRLNSKMYTYVFRVLAALFWILWIQLILWWSVYSISASILWDVFIRILTDFSLYILYRRLI